jgi:membrane protein DedA with SNARE-associated domain
MKAGNDGSKRSAGDHSAPKVYFARAQAFTHYSLIDQLLASFFGVGYLLAFALSLLGSLIPFIPIPYFPVLALLATRLNPFLLTFLSAAGASLAKLVIFLLSYWGGSKLGKERRRKISPLSVLSKRYGWLAVFIAAATPLPDDLVYIPLGIVRFSPLVFLLATFAGKLVISGVIVFGSALTLPWVFLFMGNAKNPFQFWLTAAILLVALSAAIYYVLTLDWEDLLVRRLKWIKEEDIAAENEA